jgi:hypothetical protein
MAKMYIFIPVTIKVFVMLGKYFVSVKYVFISVTLVCVM